MIQSHIIGCVVAIICVGSLLHAYATIVIPLVHPRQLATVDYLWGHILPEEIEALYSAGDFTGLKNISQHPIRNAFYDGVCLGGNRRGVHGMTPAEPLHLLELGLFKYTIEGFCVALGYSPTSKSYPKIIKDLDNWCYSFCANWHPARRCC